jgi:RNA polymerase sigma-70 factor (TIGR02960 family)
MAGRVHTGVDERERLDLAAARAGDEDAFARLVAPHRRALHAHCYRMLGSVHDADDALQDALLGAWRGLATFEGRSSLLSWLYRVTTHAAIRVSERRQRRRVLGAAYAPPRTQTADLGAPVTESVFLEPYPDEHLGPDPAVAGDPAARYEQRESVELAFVAALQWLPATQRAVLLLREVLALPAAEVAETLGTSVASVNSALQRARRTVDERIPPVSQQAALRDLGDDGARRLLDAFVGAWEARDIDGLVGLLAEDVRFAMPPLPAWFDGRDAVRAFLVERVFERPWTLRPITANGQLALACYMRDDADAFPLSSVLVLTVRDGRVAALDGFLDPDVYGPFGLPPENPPAG